jgi:hypothetical protein
MVTRLFDHFGAKDSRAITRAGLSALSVATGSTAVDEGYWADTCEALEVDARAGLSPGAFAELYAGAWAESLADDYAAVAGAVGFAPLEAADPAAELIGGRAEEDGLAVISRVIT